MDEPTTTGIGGLLLVLAGFFVKGAWEWLKARRVASSEVQAAQIIDDTHIRSELWEALARLQERTDSRIDSMQKALDESRKEYISLLGEHALLKAEHITLKNEHDALRIRYQALELRVSGA